VILSDMDGLITHFLAVSKHCEVIVKDESKLLQCYFWLLC